MVCVRMVIAMMAVLAMMARAELHAQMPPVEAFGNLPQLSGVRLSPKGTRVGYFIPIDGQRHLVAKKVGSNDVKDVFVLQMEDGEIDWFEWANEDRLIVSISFAEFRYGYPTIETRLFAINADGTTQKYLLFRGNSNNWTPQIHSDVISFLPDDSEHIIARWIDEKDFRPKAYKVNIYSGLLKPAAKGSEYTSQWIADNQSKIRARIDYVRDRKKVRVKRDAGSAWQVIADYELFVEPEFTPVGFTEQSNILLVASAHSTGRLELYEFDTNAKAFGKRIFGHPQYDLDQVLFHPKTRRMIGYSYVADRPVLTFTDDNARSIHDAVNERLPRTSNRVVTSTYDFRYHVVKAEAPKYPPEFYVFDQTSRALSKLGASYPGLNPAQLADVVPFTYFSGAYNIHAYVTLPEGASLNDGKKWPMVVLPHRSLHSRDHVRFDYLAQFIASRGWAVIQPNFRGSTGYGEKFERAAFRQWGLAIQDDVTRGVETLVSTGFADRDRICIVGQGFGGYVALMGAVKTPSLYRCAASFGGITDLITLLTDRSRYQFSQFSRIQLGSPAGDTQRLKKTSPAQQVDLINIPILLMHGQGDRQVPLKHSKEMAQALRRAGKSHKYIEFEDGDANLSREHHRVKFLKELETFLKQHLN